MQEKDKFALIGASSVTLKEFETREKAKVEGSSLRMARSRSPQVARGWGHAVDQCGYPARAAGVAAAEQMPEAELKQLLENYEDFGCAYQDWGRMSPGVAPPILSKALRRRRRPLPQGQALGLRAQDPQAPGPSLRRQDPDSRPM